MNKIWVKKLIQVRKKAFEEMGIIRQYCVFQTTWIDRCIERYITYDSNSNKTRIIDVHYKKEPNEIEIWDVSSADVTIRSEVITK